ncbi:hypothetical protein BKA61DRAFT_485641, partial [Leptodontidium sp. MPI-SDFR-AT-0119]
MHPTPNGKLQTEGPTSRKFAGSLSSIRNEATAFACKALSSYVSFQLVICTVTEYVLPDRPINTYSGKGVTKKGVIAEHHAIIYSDKAAVYLKGEKEKGLTKTPIKVSCSSHHRLDEESRLNYAKTYTVEYNVKVCFIGKVDKGSEWQLTADYNIVHPPLKSSRAPSIYKGDEHATEVKNISSMPGGSSNVMGSGSVTGYGLPKPLQMFGEVQDDASEDSLGIATSHYGGSDRLVILLLGDTMLHSLIRKIFRNFGPEKFVLKLRSCLIKFSKHIMLEAASARSFNMVQAGKALRVLARPAAISIKEKLEAEVSNIVDPLHHDGKSNTETQTTRQRGLTEGEVDVTASEEIDDEFLEQDMPPTLEDDLSKSSAYQLLREDLQLHVEPDNVRRSLFEIWPVLQDRSTALRIDYDIEWEIPSFLEKSFPVGTKLGNLMTLSGSSVNAQAQSCEDYLAEKWPDIGPLILGMLEDFLRDGMSGIGLEISFANMALASRCLSLVEYDDGLIAHGLTSILIPMIELGKDDALQWHFEGKTKQRGHKLAKVSQILRIHSIRKWHRELAPDRLVNRRCFLGWVDRAVVTIGTKDYEPIFAWSGALRSPPISTSRSYSFTFGTSGLGFVTAEGSCTNIRTAMQTSISSGIRNDVHYALKAGDENYVLLFDTAAKIGYYLPQACIVLQMIHSSISVRNYELYDRDRLVTPDNVSHFANVGPDGVFEAQRALKEYFKLMILKGETADGPVKECAIDLIGKLWHTIDDIGVKLDSLEAQFEKAGVMAPNYIHGVEWK